jgi:hypothetical protein
LDPFLEAAAGANAVTSGILMLPVERFTALIGLCPHRHTAIGAPYQAFKQIKPIWFNLKGLRPAAVLFKSGLDDIDIEVFLGG